MSDSGPLPWMSNSDVEWIPGDPFRERLRWANYWGGFAYLTGILVIMMLVEKNDLTLSPVLEGGLIAGVLGICATSFLLSWFVRHRPGFFTIGISRQGLAVQYLLFVRTVPWSRLIWYRDQKLVEGKSVWSGLGLVMLTNTQFERIQRAFYPG